MRKFGVRWLVWATSATVIVSIPSALAESAHHEGRTEYHAPAAASPPQIDGVADEPVWRRAEWQEMTHLWLGPTYSASDFQGRFKVVWTPEKIYLLGEFVDDALFDGHRDPLVQYWDDDALEIFVDEDFSGGDHQFSHKAFAYHVALDNQSIDIGPDKEPRNYSHHIESQWKQTGDNVVWEVAIDIYDDDYIDGAADNTPVALSLGKRMGLMVAYCDNDGSELRENFIGSEFAPGDDKNRGWIDAGLFGLLVLGK